MLGVRDRDAALEQIDLAGHDQVRAGGHLRLSREAEEDEVGGAGVVPHDDPPGLAGIGRAFMTHNLHRQGRDGPGPCVPDGRAGGAVEIGVGQMKQQIDDPIPAHGARHQLRHRGADAAQCRQRGEKRGKLVLIQGLTSGYGAAI